MIPLAIAPPRSDLTFLDVGFDVMRRITKEGRRGGDRDWSRWRRHVATADFAPHLIVDIRTRDIRAWHRVMLDKQALGPGKKRTISRQTILRCQSLASAVFIESIQRDIRDDNPALGAKVPKRPDERDTIDKWAFLSWHEQQLIYGCERIPYEDRLMIRIFADTGMRQGELRHLELGPDVVVDGKHPHVVVRIAGRDPRDQTKRVGTKSGKTRRIPLLPAGLAAMKEWLALLPSYAPSNPEGLVFPTNRGTLRQSGKFFGRSDSLRRHYEAAGIILRPYLHNHALRHTYATNLITGVYGRFWRIVEIQKVLGHSSSAMTERYAHLGEDAIKLAALETEAAYAAIAPLPPDTTQDLAALATEDEAAA